MGHFFALKYFYTLYNLWGYAPPSTGANTPAATSLHVIHAHRVCVPPLLCCYRPILTKRRRDAHRHIDRTPSRCCSIVTANSLTIALRLLRRPVLFVAAKRHPANTPSWGKSVQTQQERPTTNSAHGISRSHFSRCYHRLWYSFKHRDLSPRNSPPTKTLAGQRASNLQYKR